MKIGTISFTLLFFAAVAAGPIAAQDLMIYPAKGQGQDQMEKDKFECYSWAKQQTGFDPMQVPTASAPPPAKEAPKGGVLRGGAAGAAIGAVGGAIAGGKAGKGAAIGAATGGLLGGMRRHGQTRQEQHSQQQWEQQQVAEYSQKRSAYNRAYGACLEGRGYSVK